MTKNNKGAMEMSVGTIVTMVLMVTLLILGVVLIKNIFGSAKNIVDLTNDQMTDEVNKLFSEDNMIAIYPGTKYIEIKQEQTGGVGIGIQNLEEGTSASTEFSYAISIADSDSELERKCGIVKETALNWISSGREVEGILLAPGARSPAQKVLIQIPRGAPLCTIRFGITVTPKGKTGTSDFFDVKIKA